MSTDNTPAVAAPQEAPRPPVEHLTPDQTVTVLRRLKHVFNLCDELISGEIRGRIWAVYGVVGGRAPTVASFESREELCILLTTLRVQHAAERDSKYFLHMFYGQRWAVQKGDVWKLWDGRMLTPVTGGDVESFIDMSGDMGERPDLDTVVVEQPEEPEAPAAQLLDETIQAVPGVDVEVRTEPPTVGEESAPPGEDPTID